MVSLMQRPYPFPNTLDGALAEAASFISHDRPIRNCAFVGVQSPDPVRAWEPRDLAVQLGVFALRQFNVVLANSLTHADRVRTIPQVVDRAVSYGSASAASVGAAALIVDRVRVGDEHQLATTLTEACRDLGDSAVVEGGMALIAALSEQIADSLVLDDGPVHAKLPQRPVMLAGVDVSAAMTHCDLTTRPAQGAASRCGYR